MILFIVKRCCFAFLSVLFAFALFWMVVQDSYRAIDYDQSKRERVAANSVTYFARAGQ